MQKIWRQNHSCSGLRNHKVGSLRASASTSEHGSKPDLVEALLPKSNATHPGLKFLQLAHVDLRRFNVWLSLQGGSEDVCGGRSVSLSLPCSCWSSSCPLSTGLDARASLRLSPSKRSEDVCGGGSVSLFLVRVGLQVALCPLAFVLLLHCA